MLHRATPAELQARLAAERRGRPFLLYRDGDEHAAARSSSISAPERLTIGRSRARAGSTLECDDEVSHVRATIERLGDEWSLVDDGRSRNGSFIDGVRVDGRARLRDGDAIGVGRTATIVFRSPEPVESQRNTRSARQRRGTRRRSSRTPSAVCSSRCVARTPTGCTRSPRRTVRSPRNLRSLGVETIKTHMRALFDVLERRGPAAASEARRARPASARARARHAARPDLSPGGARSPRCDLGRERL